jgi:hypothetical protein
MHRSHCLERKTAPVSPVRGGAAFREAHMRSRRQTVMTPSDARAARVFYRRALKGRQVWPAGDAGASGSLWFLVAGSLIEVSGVLGGNASPIVLDVDDPDGLAQRCWDAGFTVRLNQDSTGRAPVSVFDPFGRRVDLAPRESTLNVYRSA